EPLLPILTAAADRRLTQSTCRINDDRAVCVVMASRGYPKSSESGQVIEGIDAAEKLSDVTVCHAGTAIRGGRLVTASGRVLTVVGRGADFPQAIGRAYAGVAKIH